MSSYIQAFLLIVLVFQQCQGKVTELEIIKSFVPDDCTEFADNGDDVVVHYTGTLENGQEFDSSRKPGRDPLPFVLGQGRVIKGWEQGIQGMCVGEKRKLIIPSDLAYGKKGHPPVIPPDATLTFDTELMALKKVSVEHNLLQVAQFLAVPALIAYVVYYLYDKYKKESSEGAAKGDRKSKKKRK